MKKYWSMKAKANKEADVHLYGDIGEGMFSDGVGAKEFNDDLKALGSIDQINLHVNSPGGSVFEGIAIYNMLRSHQAKVTCYVDGLAASIASVICMAGDKIVMPENAMMMIHDPWSMAIGNAEEMRKTADVMDKIKESLVMAYMGKCNLPEDEVRQMMSDETWMNGNDAAEMGFCDECTKPMKMAASVFDLSRYKKAPQPQASIVPPVNQPKMEVQAMNKCPKCGAEAINGVLPCNCEKSANTTLAAQAQQNERTRVSEIMSVGRKHGFTYLAEQAIANGDDAEKFKNSVLDAIARGEKPYVNPNITVTNNLEKKPFKHLGEQLSAVIKSSRTGRQDPQLMGIMNAASGSSEQVPSDGGFLLQEDFSTGLLARANETSIIAKDCQHIPLSQAATRLKAPIIAETSRATGSRWGGVQIYRTGEAGTPTSKKPKLAMLDLSLEKLMGLCYVTDELMNDLTAMGSIVTQAFGEEFGFKIDDEVFNGTGGGQMLGALNAPCLVSQAKETGQIAASIVAENVQKMYARMPARLLGGAKWYINQEIWPALFQLQMVIGTGGVPLFQPPSGMSGSPYGTLMGRPIVPIEQAAALGTQGDIVFANFSQYVIIEKGGLDVQTSIHVQFLTDETAFRFIMRNNGQPIWLTALTPYKGTATQSPFIALATRS